ncbi:hypothetical protein HRbin02_00173 [Candidatus Calditenuaceae archaeon HR02]|nr:hypothetical protein HRbin02_00173 [Candidatus Calditenuaceae archaeon HR02]
MTKRLGIIVDSELSVLERSIGTIPVFGPLIKHVIALYQAI